MRCLFSYDPLVDVYHPCRELSGVVRAGQILRLVDWSDEWWWQAFVLGENEEKEDSAASPILVPSKAFQEKRFRIVKSLLAEEESKTKTKKKKSLSRQSILSSVK